MVRGIRTHDSMKGSSSFSEDEEDDLLRVEDGEEAREDVREEEGEASCKTDRYYILYQKIRIRLTETEKVTNR